MAKEPGKDGKPILAFAKKGSGVPSIVYAEALEVALCYGRIDSQVRAGPPASSKSSSPRLEDAKKPETRARRLEKFVGMLERGERLY